MFDWTRMKYYLKQKIAVAMNLPAYGADLNDFDGANFSHPARGFKCNVDGTYSIYYAGMVGMDTPYVEEVCVSGMDYAGSIVNIKSGAQATVIAAQIIVKW